MTEAQETDSVCSVIELRKKARKRGVREVCLSNGHILLCPDDVSVRWHLRPGATLAEEALSRLQAEAEVALAVREALEIIARAPRSEQELVTRLRRKGFGAAATTQAVARVGELGYIDDEAYARMMVARLERKGDMGYLRMRQELLRRGISVSVADAVLGPVDHLQERERALKLARRRVASSRAPSTDASVRRLAGYLQRRGFGSETIAWCLRQVVSEVDTNRQ